MRDRRWSWLGVVVVGGLVMGGLAGCADEGGDGDSAGPEATTSGPPEGWVDPATSWAEGPGMTATPTPTDCSAASLEIILWRGWDGPIGVQTETLAVDQDSVRLTDDGTFAVFDYYDAAGKLPRGTLVGDCGQGYWQLFRSVDDDLSCADEKTRTQPRYYAALVELGICEA